MPTPWFLRCLPILILATIILLDILSLGTPYEYFFILHLALMHLFAFLAAIRMCWATFTVTKELTVTRSRCDALEKEAMENEHGCREGRRVVHAIVVPSYKEDFDTLRSTLRILARHPQARRQYHIIIALETRDSTAQHTSSQLQRSFPSSFLQMSFTFHPADIPGEAAGKSSNVNWAAQEFMNRLELQHSYEEEDVILTVMDADTHLRPSYFTTISHTHLSSPTTFASTQLYTPPLVFSRNASSVPLFVRMADIMWSGAGLSGFHPQSRICIPTSVYSIPLSLVRAVNGWDTGPEAIGEDMHMYLKCFFSTRGRLRVIPIYAPASCSNVCSTLRGWRGYCNALGMRWRQSVRHMWGSLDSGYAVYRGLLQLHPQTVYQQVPHIQPASIPTTKSEPEQSPYDPESTSREQGTPYWTYTLLFHRFFEAHSLPLHLTSLIIISIIHTIITPNPQISAPLSLAISLADKFRILSFLVVCLWMGLYNRFHNLAIDLEEAEARSKAGTRDLEEEDGEKVPSSSSKRNTLQSHLEILALPLAGFMFSLPGLMAQLSHLWTAELVYHVSAKPKAVAKQVPVPVLDAEKKFCLVELEDEEEMKGEVWCGVKADDESLGLFVSMIEMTSRFYSFDPRVNGVDISSLDHGVGLSC